MGLKERLEAEARGRAEALSSRAVPGICVVCGTNGSGALEAAEFRWRKQVGRSPEHHVRVEHVSVHPMCPTCLADLRRTRRVFWLARYLGGFALAGGICGVVTAPILLWRMNLRPEEGRLVTGVGWASALLLLVGVLGLRVARWYSVPGPLLDMTGSRWECVAVTRQPPA